MKKGSKKAFRPAMTLTSGELSGLTGCFLLMTATATTKTRKLLQNQLTEIKQWKNMIEPPLRENVLLVIPPPEILSTSYTKLLAPFIDDMKYDGKRYLVLVRSINKGSQIFLHLLKSLCGDSHSDRNVAFFHRNSSEERKLEILTDLKLPLTSPVKKLCCVVATVSLGNMIEIELEKIV